MCTENDTIIKWTQHLHKYVPEENEAVLKGIPVFIFLFIDNQLAGSHRLMSRPDTCLGIRTHLSICGGMEHFIFRLMYV